MNVDYDLWEGQKVSGSPRQTLSRGPSPTDGLSTSRFAISRKARCLTWKR